MNQQLQHSPAEVLQQLFIDKTFATDPTLNPLQAWPVYVANEPNAPDEVITLTDTAGRSDGRFMLNGVLYQHYGFQIRIRSTSHPTGFLKANYLRGGMSEDTYNETVVIGANTYAVCCISKIGLVLPLGKEPGPTKRNLFTLNAMVVLRIKS